MKVRCSKCRTKYRLKVPPASRISMTCESCGQKLSVAHPQAGQKQIIVDPEYKKIEEPIVKERVIEEPPKIICSGCGTDLQEGKKFCGNCGLEAKKPNTCQGCGLTIKQNDKFCGHCGASVSSVTGKRGIQPEVAKNTRPEITQAGNQGKNPALACVLSLLIVGAGQFYNGDVAKGVYMLLGAIILGAMSAGIFWLGIGIWSAIDAYQGANK